MKTNLVYPGPARISWTLGDRFTKNSVAGFIQAARRTVKGKLNTWTIEGYADGKDVLQVEVAGICFPGYFPGDTLEDGKPAYNVYDVDLDKRQAAQVAKLLRLLLTFGAKETSWERSENVPAMS